MIRNKKESTTITKTPLRNLAVEAQSSATAVGGKLWISMIEDKMGQPAVQVNVVQLKRTR